MSKTWPNYKTGQSEIREESPLDFHDYIPQDSMVQMLYDGYVKAGMTPLDAFIAVMRRLTKQQE